MAETKRIQKCRQTQNARAVRARNTRNVVGSREVLLCRLNTVRVTNATSTTEMPVVLISLPLVRSMKINWFATRVLQQIMSPPTPLPPRRPSLRAPLCPPPPAVVAVVAVVATTRRNPVAVGVVNCHQLRILILRIPVIANSCPHLTHLKQNVLKFRSKNGSFCWV